MSLVSMGAIVFGVAAASVGVLWVARQSPWNERFATEVRQHDEAFEFLGVAYAVLLAFVVIQAYTSYNDAKSGAETEAAAVLKLSRTSEAFAPDQLHRLEGVLVCYGRAVIHDAWPKMQEGQESSLVNDWGTRYRQAALQTQAHSFVQRASFRQLLTEQDERIDGRRARLAEAFRVVPPPLWFVLGLGGVLTIGWVILGSSRSGSFFVQATVIASVAAMVASVLVLVYFLDHPFADHSGGITPSEMEHTLATIAEEGGGPRGRGGSSLYPGGRSDLSLRPELVRARHWQCDRGAAARNLEAVELLRQPGGFEGLFTGRVFVAARDLSVADGEDRPVGRIRLNAAEPRASAEPLGREHGVPTGVNQLHELLPEPVEHVDPVLEPCPHGVPAVNRTSGAVEAHPLGRGIRRHR